MRINPVQSSQSEEKNSIVFEEELDQLDADQEEVYRGKLSLKAKEPRTGSIKKHKKQEYQQMKCDKIQNKRKRKKIIESSSDQDQEWQPSEQNNSTDDEEYFGKSANKQVFKKKAKKW